MPGSVLLLRVWSKGWNEAKLCSFIGDFLCLLPFHPQASPPSSFQTQLTKASFSNSLELSRLPSLFLPTEPCILPSYSVICFPAETRSDSLYPEYLALCILSILPCASVISCLVPSTEQALRNCWKDDERMNEWMGQGFTGWYSCCLEFSSFVPSSSLFCEFQTGKREGKGEEDSFPIKVSLRIHRGDCHLEERKASGIWGNLNISKNCGWVRSVVIREVMRLYYNGAGNCSIVRKY